MRSKLSRRGTALDMAQLRLKAMVATLPSFWHDQRWLPNECQTALDSHKGPSG